MNEKIDNVNHPNHYKMPGGIEVIDMIKNVLGYEGFLAYCRGNVIKYICRYQRKNGREDLEKAIVYTRFMLDMMQKYDCSQVKAAPRGIVLPHPCDGPLYEKWTDDDYLMKVVEEVNEMVEAHGDLKRAKSSDSIVDCKDHLYQECTDVITAVTGFMDKLGCDEDHRQMYQKLINHSNSVRDGGRRFKQNGKE